MGIKNYIYTYFKTNWLIFFAIIFIFLAGIAVGGYALIMMNAENITSIKDYTDNFFSATVLNGTDNKSIFIFGFIDSFKISFIALIMAYPDNSFICDLREKICHQSVFAVLIKAL